MTLIFYIALCGTLFFAAALIVFPAVSERARTNRRVRQVTTGVIALDSKSGGKRRAVQTFQRMVRSLRVRFGLVDDEKLRQRFSATGLRGAGHVEIYFAARVLGPVAAIGIASFLPSHTFLWAVSLGAIAYMAPDFWLERAIKKRRERIRRSIPDAVDLLVICVDAGLGLDQAMLRVGQELSISHSEINEEFLQINREQRAGKPRMDAWQSMADRTKVPEIAAFTGMLAQTEKFGTPIARALSVFADGIRQKRRQRAEEMAAKTTVKMIFPLVLCIFPSMFIVLLAPAVLSIGRGLSALH